MKTKFANEKSKSQNPSFVPNTLKPPLGTKLKIMKEKELSCDFFSKWHGLFFY